MLSAGATLTVVSLEATALERSACSSPSDDVRASVRVRPRSRRRVGSALQRLGARVTGANIALDDHPNEKRFSDRIETVTVDEREGLGGTGRVIR
jgi:hypothetical protein